MNDFKEYRVIVPNNENKFFRDLLKRLNLSFKTIQIPQRLNLEEYKINEESIKKAEKKRNDNLQEVLNKIHSKRTE